ncbi:DEAD/DEAH box helicase [Cellulomonas sp. H30R-01]|uniref:DEAD/DEAH box helicase n=2 Tax=Cellulomonas TaxID=1707 RepID=UPI00138B7B6B|nr:DEAD/DEAH box helicase [Cellulomonas sp. H30R-01]QHT56178.1 DEAD/DEAH box helicase [Cellulomonas sp. H30R-01]
MTTFADLGVPAVLVRALADDGITSPFPIQTATLRDSLAGTDVLGRGRTGSGKTLAFAIPVVARTAAAGRRTAPSRPRALVLAPTRELASQIDATIAPLAAAAGLSTTVVFGGVAQSRQVTALQRGADILVACPGRLEDLLRQGLVSLDDVAVTVLDEADHMADLGFLPVVKRLLDRTPRTGQRLLFSATLDNGVDVLVKRYLTKPVEHAVDTAQSPVAAMTHHLLEVADADSKKAVVRALASGTGRRVLFMRTKHQAKKLAKQLTADGIPSVDLHGNLGQGARERNLEAFSSGAVRVLVATDIAARGIHVDDVGLVVHVDPPAEHKAYLHRSGRTARAGAGGDVVTLVLPEQRADVRALTRAAKITAQPRPVALGDAHLAALVGEVAAPVAPAPAAPATSSRASQGGGSRGSGGRGGAGRGAGSSARGGSASSSSNGARSGGGPRAAGGGRAEGAGRAGGAGRATGAGRAGGTRSAASGTSSTLRYSSGGPTPSTAPTDASAGAAGAGRRGRRGGRGRAGRPAGAPSGG